MNADRTDYVAVPVHLPPHLHSIQPLLPLLLVPGGIHRVSFLRCRASDATGNTGHVKRAIRESRVARSETTRTRNAAADEKRREQKKGIGRGGGEAEGGLDRAGTLD